MSARKPRGEVNINSSRAKEMIKLCEAAMETKLGIEMRFPTFDMARKARSFIYALRRSTQYNRGVGYDAVIDVSVAVKSDDKGPYLHIYNGDFSIYATVINKDTGEVISAKDEGEKSSSSASIDNEDILALEDAKKKLIEKGVPESDADILARVLLGHLDKYDPSAKTLVETWLPASAF